MPERRKPGEVRDAILGFLRQRGEAGASVSEIRGAITSSLGSEVAASSVRSYLNLNTPDTFTRIGRGKYRLKESK